MAYNISSGAVKSIHFLHSRHADSMGLNPMEQVPAALRIGCSWFETHKSFIMREIFRVQDADKESIMLYWAVIFLIVAIIAGAFGFFGVEGLATEIAKILFVIFIIVFLISLVGGFRGKR